MFQSRRHIDKLLASRPEAKPSHPVTISHHPLNQLLEQLCQEHRKAVGLFVYFLAWCLSTGCWYMVTIGWAVSRCWKICGLEWSLGIRWLHVVDAGLFCFASLVLTVALLFINQSRGCYTFPPNALAKSSRWTALWGYVFDLKMRKG